MTENCGFWSLSSLGQVSPGAIAGCICLTNRSYNDVECSPTLRRISRRLSKYFGFISSMLNGLGSSWDTLSVSSFYWRLLGRVARMARRTSRVFVVVLSVRPSSRW